MDVGEATKGESKPSNSNYNNFLSKEDVNISIGVSSSGNVLSKEVFSVVETTNSPVQYRSQDDIDEEEKEAWMKSLEEEQMKWDALESVQYSASGHLKVTALISFSEVLQHFQMKQFDTADIKPTIPRTGLSAFIHFLFGPPRLHYSLIEERDLIFCIAQTQLNDQEEIHRRILQTIYKKLNGTKLDCPRRGSHWQSIGFQGDDPGTDLRGVGFLGLMHLLHGITDPNVTTLFTEFYRLSLDDEQNYPFSIVSINVTRIALQVLREEKLSRDCNKRKQVIAVLNDFYIAVFHHFYHIWKTQFKTMKDSGHVMQDLEKQARKKPRALLQDLENVLKERKTKSKNQIPTVSAEKQTPIYLRRTVSGTSSASSISESKNISDHSMQIGTESPTRFRAQKKTENLPDFTDIRDAETQRSKQTTDL